MLDVGQALDELGVQVLRGGAYKPRTVPYSFQGLGQEGLDILQEVGERYSLLTVSEVIDAAYLAEVASRIDILQVGSRNMQNFSLLKALGKVSNPVLLKRGFAATYFDLLAAAEYILAAGNPRVILCERGIRTFETYTRNTLDINAVASLQELTHLPVWVDPSHATGKRSLVAPAARAAVAAGADGLLIEVHPYPDQAWTDGDQTLDIALLKTLSKELRKIVALLRGEGSEAQRFLGSAL
jgi:3-deoxy-7-phosphoheptulonate synthase